MAQHWRQDIHPSKEDLADLFEYACRRNGWFKPNGEPSMRQLSIHSKRPDGEPYSEGLIHSLLRRPSRPNATSLEAIAQAMRLGEELTGEDLLVAAGFIRDPARIAHLKTKVDRARRFNQGDPTVRLERPGALAPRVRESELDEEEREVIYLFRQLNSRSVKEAHIEMMRALLRSQQSAPGSGSGSAPGPARRGTQPAQERRPSPRKNTAPQA